MQRVPVDSDDDFSPSPASLNQIDRSASIAEPPAAFTDPADADPEPDLLPTTPPPAVAIPRPSPPPLPPPPAPRPGEPTHSPVPGLLARHTVSVLAGAPFSGRMRFLLPQLENYAAGLPFLGIPCPGEPEQLGMILCGSGPESIQRRIDQLGLDHLSDPAIFPIVKWTGAVKDPDEYGFDFPDSFTLEKCYRELTLIAGREPKFLIIDAVQMLASRGRASDFHSVSMLYDALEAWNQVHNCTLLTIAVTSKSRGDAGYRTVREGIFGSVAWSSRAHAVITIDECKVGDTFRKVAVTSKSFFGTFPVLYATFGDYGRLVLCDDPDAPRTTSLDQLDQRLAESGQTEFTRGDFLEWGEELGFGTRTVDRWIGTRAEAGILLKTGARRSVIYSKIPEPEK